MLRFSLRQLEYFAKVAETQSITIASKELNVSSPSISTAISQLEQELGVHLLNRHLSRGVTLTPVGERVLKQTRKVLIEANLLGTSVGNYVDEIQGPLSVGCLKTFTEIVFPSLRKIYESCYPEVKVFQYDLDHIEIIKFLQESKIDVALTFNFDVPNDLVFLPLVELSPFAIMNDSHPLANKTLVFIEELAEYPMILIDSPYYSDHILSLYKKKSVLAQISEKVNGEALLRVMVANGYGYSITYVKPQTNQTTDGKLLKFVPIGGKAGNLNLGIIVPKSKTDLKLIQSFINHCKASIESMEIPGLKNYF